MVANGRLNYQTHRRCSDYYYYYYYRKARCSQTTNGLSYKASSSQASGNQTAASVKSRAMENTTGSCYQVK